MLMAVNDPACYCYKQQHSHWYHAYDVISCAARVYRSSQTCTQRYGLMIFSHNRLNKNGLVAVTSVQTTGILSSKPGRLPDRILSSANIIILADKISVGTYTWFSRCYFNSLAVKNRNGAAGTYTKGRACFVGMFTMHATC